MSITITIEANSHYVDANCPELVRRETIDCPYEPNGTYTFANYPFELNITNCNFADLWRAFGLEFDYCGSIDPAVLLRAMRQVAPRCLTCAATADKNIYSGGRRLEQVTRYFGQLGAICREALKRHAKVCWG